MSAERTKPGHAMLERRKLVKDLLVDRRDLMVVCGLGSATYDVAAAGDHPLNLYLWGAMGGAAMIGLGLALAKPDRRVAVLTGDGEALMGLGALATIGVKQPKNLVIVVLDNGHYGETGMQASHTKGGTDLVAIAKGCGFTDAPTLTEQSSVARVRELLHTGRGPILVNAHISSAETPRFLPERDGHAIKLRFMQAVKEGATFVHPTP
jgi:thiamine pyrophosphate-dependent acetolactate synthase large subunit-like protein